eukprot:s2071_g9.t1
MEDQAVAAGLYPSPRTFAALLEAALSAGDSTAAEYWYQGVLATPGQPAVASFNLLLDVAARKGRVKLLRISGCQNLSWYQQALEAGFRLSAGDFEEMIDAALVRNDVESAAFWFKKSADELTLPTEVFNQLLSRAAQLEGFSMAASLFAEFGAGITPNVETFNSMMLAAARNGDTAAAEIWYTRAQGAGCKPDELTKGDLAAAEVWLRQAEEVGIKPTLKMLKLGFVYSKIAQDLCTGNMREAEVYRALACLQDGSIVESATDQTGACLRADLFPQSQSNVLYVFTGQVVCGPPVDDRLNVSWFGDLIGWFTSLIDAAVRSENDEAARHWPLRWVEGQSGSRNGEAKRYETALKAGVQPSIRTFNTLMSGPARQGVSSECLGARGCGICREVVSCCPFHGSDPRPGDLQHAARLQQLMNAAARAGDLASAENWYEKALSARVDPNVVTFTTLISAAANQGRLKEAEAWFCKATKQGRGPGIRPNVAMYNAVLSVAAKSTGNAAEKWLGHMER